MEEKTSWGNEEKGVQQQVQRMQRKEVPFLPCVCVDVSGSLNLNDTPAAFVRERQSTSGDGKMEDYNQDLQQ